MKDYIKPIIDIEELHIDDIVLTSIITDENLDITNPKQGIDEEF